MAISILYRDKEGAEARVTKEGGHVFEVRDGFRAVTHVGAVLSTYEKNYYSDSDFCALVWDGTKVTEVEYATTRFATYGNFASVDATPEVLAEAKAWHEVAAFNSWKITNALASEKIAPGKLVTVLSGKNKGLIGKVTSIKTFGYNNESAHVMFTPENGAGGASGGVTWVWKKLIHLKVNNPENYLEPEEEGKKHAKMIAGSWRSF